MKIDIRGVIVPNGDKWIYDEFGMESTCLNDVERIIQKAKGEPLDIYIDSGGGDVFAGSDIYSAIRAYQGKINIHVTGLAASAASVIACAGYSDISPTAMVMVHNVSGVANGDYHTMDQGSEVLQKANKAIAAAYVAKTGMPERDALQLMEKESWLTAAEAVEKGLIDQIAKNENQSAPSKLVAAYCATVIPENVINRVREALKPPIYNIVNEDFLCRKAQSQLNLLKIKMEDER